MNIIKPITDGEFTELNNVANSIFLAGPCPRKNYNEEDWRQEAFEILERLGFKGNVITPTNDQFQKYLEKDANCLEKQTWWEYEAMKKASAIVFWIARDIKGGHPAFTTNYEFGDWYDKESVFIGAPVDAEKNEYPQIRCKLKNVPWYNTLEEVLAAAVKKLQDRPEDKFFTSDTHFSQQRTLELSRRPFINITEMDLEMISNWNKKVTMNDVVYHAGDFGDINTMKNTLSNLNFKELNLVMGNYDRDVAQQIQDIIDSMPERKINIMDCARFEDGKRQYYIIHEPDRGTYAPEYPNEIVLYGHIHGRAFAKKNGFDLATDYHHYTPISLEEVQWFANAIQYWDSNVFCQQATLF